jgi:hypothetical protein
MSGRWLADPVQSTADHGGNSTRHPGQVERSPTGDLARDEALPIEVKAEQRPQVGSPVHPDARSTLVHHQIVTSRRGVKQYRQVESAVADVAAPVAGGRPRPIHDAGESVVTPQHIEVLVVAVDQDLFVTKRPRGSLAGGVTQAAVGQPVQWAVPNAVPVRRRRRCAIAIPPIPPGLRVVGYGVDRGLRGRELAQPGPQIPGSGPAAR